MFDKARYIAVEGPVGAGATSLAKRLSEKLAAEAILEQPELNVFLKRFYQDPQRWALSTQLSFFFLRGAQMNTLAQRLSHEQKVVSDYIAEKDQLFAELNLTPDELVLYRQITSQLKPAHPAPDLVIYLQAQPATLFERIARNKTDAEHRITEEYLQRVTDRYASFFHQYDAAPLFIVDTQTLNPVDKEEDFELLYARLKNMRSYREFFGYAK